MLGMGSPARQPFSTISGLAPKSGVRAVPFKRGRLPTMRGGFGMDSDELDIASMLATEQPANDVDPTYAAAAQPVFEPATVPPPGTASPRFTLPSTGQLHAIALAARRERIKGIGIVAGSAAVMLLLIEALVLVAP